MPRTVTASVNGGGASMSAPAQITIAGVLGKEHVAALVEVAIAAGAALLVQPRTIAALPAVVAREDPPADRRRALPPARVVTRHKSATPTSSKRPGPPPALDVDGTLLERVRARYARGR